MADDQQNRHLGKSRQRLTRLDALRGLAAAGVVAFHLVSWPHLKPHAGQPLDWLFYSGWTLVDLFFVLSGYVFAHVYAAPGSLNRPHALGGFWVARVARLWPLHLLTLGLFALFNWGGGNNLPHFLWHLSLLQGFDPDAGLAFNGVTWSISVELVCYAIFSLAARAGDRTLLVVSLAMVLLCGGRLAQNGHLQGAWTGDFLPRAGLGFFLGQLLWRWRTAMAGIPIPLLLIAALAGFRCNDTVVGALLPLTLLSWSSLVLLALRLPVLELAPFQWLGERSFTLYMVHMLVVEAVDTLWPPLGMQAMELLIGQSVIVLLILLATEAAYRLVDLPARIAIRRRWAAWCQANPARTMQPA